MISNGKLLTMILLSPGGTTAGAVGAFLGGRVLFWTPPVGAAGATLALTAARRGGPRLLPPRPPDLAPLSVMMASRDWSSLPDMFAGMVEVGGGG